MVGLVPRGFLKSLGLICRSLSTLEQGTAGELRGQLVWALEIRLETYTMRGPGFPRSDSGGLAEFFRFVGGGANSAHECATKFAFLELVQAFDGGSTWAGNHIFEGAGMKASFEHHFRGTERGLGGKPCRQLSRQTRRDAAIAQTFDKKVDVSGAAAAEARDGVEKRFFYCEGDTNRGEKLFGKLAVFGEGGVIGSEGRSGGAHEGGRVWHDANQAGGRA